MNKTLAYIIGIIYVTIWNAFVIGGCAYLVFWKEHSGWWFVLAVVLCDGVTLSTTEEEKE